MPKLVKQYYYAIKENEKKVNCYKITIPKELVSQADIDPEQNLTLRCENGKIIIERG